MPKIVPELPAAKVHRLRKRGLHPVGGVPGLALRVKETGARSWVLRVMAGGRRREYGLGGFPAVTLEQARERARDAAELLRQGVDPAEHRRAASDRLRSAEAKRVTFKSAAEQFIERKRQEFRNEKHGAQWESTLETYAYPVIGSLPVDQVELGHVKKILDPIWMEKTETATRLRGRIESVLAYATASGYREGDNPARWRGNLDAVMPKPRKISKVQHHRALPIDELPAFMVKLAEREGTAARALEFVILTAARSGEVRGATWDEIDLEAETWTVPGDRMKAGKEHVVPLSDPAVRLLKRLPRMKGSNYVFAAPRGGPLSDMSISAVCRRMEVDAVPHGFRSTFRDWCAERTNYPREVAEKALAHVIPNAVEAAYRRGDLIEKRRRLMREWARFCLTPTKPGKVVPIRKAR